MDLVSIRKKAKQEKEKKAEESTLRQAQDDEKEIREEKAKPEPEIISEKEVTVIQEKVAEPQITSAEKIEKIVATPSIEEDAEIEVISFRLGEEIYGVRIEHVKEILKPLQITPVPRAPDYLKGVTSLRGEIIPVFDLKKRLGLEALIQGQEKGKGRILIVSVRGEVMGALIDEIKGVVKLHREYIEPPPTIISGLEADFLEGVSRIDNHFIGLLNIEEVMKI